jgi:uncharacterized membrane protein YcaP (DUF421 family)
MTITAIRTIVIYLVLIAAMRIMGKRQLSDLQPIELVVTLLIADMASVPMQESGVPLLNGLVPIAVLVSLELLLSGLMLKMPKVAALISGNPVVIIRDGQLQQKALKKLRMTVADLAEYMRRQNVFDIKQVQYAVAETGGQISLFLYPAQQPATAADVGISPPDDGMPVVVINDGRMSDWAMKLCNVDEQWVRSTLRKEQCTPADVFLMTADKSKQYFILRKEDSP